MVFPTFLNLSLNLAIRSSWSEPQSAPGLIFADCIELLHLWLQRINQSDFLLTIWWCPCVVFCCVVWRGCLLWPVRSLWKTLLALPCFIPYSKAKCACYSRCFLTSYFCIPVPYNEKDIFFGVLVLKGLVGLHRPLQLQLLQHYWLGHRIGLPWYWIACLGNEQRSFCRFWDFIHVLHFGLFCWPWWLLHFF